MGMDFGGWPPRYAKYKVLNELLLFKFILRTKRGSVVH
jgi:hypothetical protein